MAKRRRRSLSPTAWWGAPIVASVFVVVFALLNNGRHSMWFDETYSVSFAERAIKPLLYELANDEANMGPYYLTLWAWRHLGTSDVWLRSLSMVWTVAALWIVWGITRRWANNPTAAVAVGMLALNPFMLSWTVQARGYTMVVALSATSLWLADRVRTTTSVPYSVAFGLTAAILVATNLAALFIVVAEVCCLLAFGNRKRLVFPLGVGALVSAVLFAPFGYSFLTNRRQVRWIPELSWHSFGASTTRAMGGPLAATAIALGLVALATSMRSPAQRPRGAMILASVIVGLLGVALFSLVIQPLYIHRYLIGVLPIATVGSAMGLHAMSGQRMRHIGLVLLPTLVLVGAVVDPSATTQSTLEDFRRAARLVDARIAEGDSVIDVDGHTEITLGRYLEPRTSVVPILPTGDPQQPYGLGGIDTEPSRVWLVLRDASFDTDAAARERLAWITALYPAVSQRWELTGINLELRRRER